MNVMVLIELLDEAMQEASSLPLTSKKLVDVDKCMDIIRDLRINLPEDIKDAEQIVADKDQVISDAQMEAQHIVSEAERRFRAILDEHEITRKAHDQADEIIASANAEAQEIRMGAIGYANEVMDRLEDTSRRILNDIMSNREDLDNM
ncbi:MAG: ATPase [Christensenellales bacterium]|jgi:F0F1-type ATP synthase membrane subunit b/b'